MQAGGGEGSDSMKIYVDKGDHALSLSPILVSNPSEFMKSGHCGVHVFCLHLLLVRPCHVALET